MSEDHVHEESAHEGQSVGVYRNLWLGLTPTYVRCAPLVRQRGQLSARPIRTAAELEKLGGGAPSVSREKPALPQTPPRLNQSIIALAPPCHFSIAGG